MKNSIIKTLLLTIILLSPLFATTVTKETRGVVAFELFDNTVLHEEKSKEGLFSDINVSLSLFKSKDKNITIESISNYDLRFKPMSKNERFQDKEVDYWLKVDLQEGFPSGKFVVSYGDVKVLADSFSKTQKIDKFEIGGVEHLKFSYDSTKDGSVYYFKLSSVKYENAYRFLYITTNDNFYNEVNTNMVIHIILGIILGLIFMAGLYNGAMYYYNRDISFLYYMLMEWSISLVLFNMIGIINFTDLPIARSETYYSLCSLLSVLFTTLFTQSFLDTKQHSPKLNRGLNIIIVLLFLDAIFSIFYVSLIFKYHLLPFFALGYIYLGYKRAKEGFKPAMFYVAGWSVLVFTLFLDSFWQLDFWVSPIFLGTAVEAIFFSLALSYKIKMMADEKEQQKELMVHQSKLASMGEMIGNIAHQWRQPLTHLSYTVMNIQDAFKHKSLDEVYLDKKVDEANTQIEFMSQTIDDFRDFYALSKTKESFSLADESRQVLSMMQHSLDEVEIVVELVVVEDLEITNYKNEYKQVVLNLLTNAKDALVERLTIAPKITIRVDKNRVTISDNAGGIQEKNIDKIFEPYFSTKENSSGIGLYMSKMIVEKNMGGRLSVLNDDKGAVFRVVF